MNTTIDLNCDMGESFGAWSMGNDAQVLEHVSSANIACGFHAGDPATMHRTIAAAIQRRVAIGGHPSFPDLQGFGRRAMSITPEDAYDLVLYQIAAIAGFCRALGVHLSHVKPHGALYNMAARDAALAHAIAFATRDFDASLILFGLAGGELVRAGRSAGLQVANEVFADRSYQADGTLTPRTQPGAVIKDLPAALGQIERIVCDGKVVAVDGSEIDVEADTICIHGDAPGAVDFARALRELLGRLGVAVCSPRQRRPS